MGARKLVVQLLAALLIFPLLAEGQPATDEDSIKVGVLRDWPPYFIPDEHGEPSGFAVESFEIVAEGAGITPRYHVYETFPELLDALDAREIDMIANVGILEERDYLFTRPIDTFSIVLFIRASTPGSPTLHELEGEVAVVRSNIGEILARQDPSLDARLYENVREAIFRLIAGDVDGLVYPELVVWALAREAGVENDIEVSGPKLAEVKRAIAVVPGRQDLVDRLDRAIEDFVVSPEYEQIHARWLVPAPPFWTIRRVVVAGLTILGLLILGFATWYWVKRRQAEAILRRSEEKYRTLFESHGAAIVVCDTERTIIDINPAFEDLFGYEAEEIIGATTRALYDSDDDFREIGLRLQQISDGGSFITTIRFRTKSGRTFVGETNGFYRYDDRGEVSAFIGVIRDVTEDLENRIELEEKRKDLERLSAKLMTLQEAERKHIARELHDELGGILTALYFDVTWLRENTGDPRVTKRTVEMEQQIERATKRVREVARALRPAVIDDFGLIPALEDLVTDFSEKFEIEANLSVHPIEMRVRKLTDINLYRIAQEALTNVARHSNASRVDLRLRLNEDIIVMELRDDGRGIGPENAGSPESLGIVGMQERAEMMGGSFVVERFGETGTVVRVAIPVTGEDA